jgi:hypothetical protein
MVVKRGFPEYRFQGHMVVKNGYDLSAWGWGSRDLYSEAAWDHRQPPISPYYCTVVPVPILESQSVLVSGGR